MNSIDLSTWITAFFVLAGFAAVLAVAGIAMVLPRRTAFVNGTVFDVEVPTDPGSSTSPSTRPDRRSIPVGARPVGRARAMPVWTRCSWTRFSREEEAMADVTTSSTVRRASGSRARDCSPRRSAAGPATSPTRSSSDRPKAPAARCAGEGCPPRSTSPASAPREPGERRGHPEAGRTRWSSAGAATGRPGGLHLPGPVRRPRPHDGPHRRDARRGRQPRRPPAGPLAAARPGLAVRRRPRQRGVREVLRGGRHPPQGRYDDRRPARRPGPGTTSRASAPARGWPPSSGR